MDIPDPGRFPGGETEAGRRFLRLPTGVTSILDGLQKGPFRRSASELARAPAAAWRRYVQSLGIDVNCPIVCRRDVFKRWRDSPPWQRRAL